MEDKIVEKELSYKLGGVFFKIHGELGRFCRERQYGDAFEAELNRENIKFRRGHPIEIAGRKSNFVDFYIEDKILVDLKTKSFIDKEDFYQMRRYLDSAGVRLGIIVNFRDKFLKPKRVLCPSKFVDSHEFVVLNRSGQSLIEILIALAIGSLLIGAAVFAVVFMLKSNTTNQKLQAASLFGRSIADQIHTIADGNWFDIYNLASGTQYFIAASGTTVSSLQGQEGVLEDDRLDNLAAYWKFDEATTTTAHDSTSNNNDAVLVGGATRLGSCKISRCLSFDGSDDYASSSDVASLDLTSAVTFSAWIKPTSTNGVVLGAKNDGTNFAWEAALESNKFVGRVNAAGNAAQSSSTISASVWTHVAMVYSQASSTISVFVNGVLDGSATYSTVINTNSVAVSLGRRLSGTPGFFNGLIDDVRIYSTALLADDIRTLYNSGIFTRYFSVDNVERDGSGDIIASGGTDDPSTRKVTVSVEWWKQDGTATTSVTLSDYVTRWKNRVFSQTDWSGGAGSDGPVIEPGNQYSSGTSIATSSGAIRIDGL